MNVNNFTQQLEYLIDRFKRDMNPKFISHKDLILNQAKECGGIRFRLLATMNNNISIFNWCDDQSNFIGMCYKIYDDDEKSHIVEYTLDELPEMIDNAEQYLKSIKESDNYSYPWLVSSLQLMEIE